MDEFRKSMIRKFKVDRLLFYRIFIIPLPSYLFSLIFKIFNSFIYLLSLIQVSTSSSTNSFNSIIGSKLKSELKSYTFIILWSPFFVTKGQPFIFIYVKFLNVYWPSDAISATSSKATSVILV